MSLTESFPASLTPLVSSDVETIDFVKSVIDGREGEKVAHALEGGLRLVGKELGERVSDKYETLLANVNATHAIEGKLLRSNERVEALAQAVQRIEGQIAKPFNQLGESLEQYERMLESAELLRQVQRAVTQVKRLRDAMSPPVRTAAAASSAASPAPKPSPAAARRVDLPKAATAMHELETIFAAADLSGVSVIDTELAFIRESGVSIRSQATTMLQSGLSEQSPAQMGAALQVFFNLHELPEAAIHAATEVASGLKAAVASAFDPSVFGVDAAIKAAGGGGVLGDLGATSQSKNGMPPSSVHGSWKQTLWTRAEGVGEALYVAALRLADLQKVIVKKRDPLTHVLFAALIEQTTKSAGGAAKEEEEETAVSSSSAAANDRWGCADPSILASSLMLTSIVTDLNWASPTATAAAVAAPSKEASSAAASPPLFALWAPLCTALNASIESAMASAPFVRSCLSTEPSRLLTILMAAAERFEAQLSPAPVSDEAYYALNPEALTRNLGGAVDLYRRDLIGEPQRRVRRLARGRRRRRGFERGSCCGGARKARCFDQQRAEEGRRGAASRSNLRERVRAVGQSIRESLREHDRGRRGREAAPYQRRASQRSPIAEGGRACRARQVRRREDWHAAPRGFGDTARAGTHAPCQPGHAAAGEFARARDQHAEEFAAQWRHSRR